MQQIQEKYEVARDDYMVSTDHLLTALVEMHQGNVADLLDNTYWWISNLSGGSEIQESQSSFGRGQRVKKPSLK